jgi:hypothetical protein
LDSACSKEVSYVKIFQFHDVLNESERYCATANGLLLEGQTTHHPTLRHLITHSTHFPTHQLFQARQQHYTSELISEERLDMI